MTGKNLARILLLLFAGLLIALASWSVNRQLSTGVDFPIFYEAANHRGVAAGYIYPPLLAFLLRPLALLPLAAATWAWYGLTACGFLWLFALVFPRDCRHSVMNIACLILFLAAVAQLARLNFELGQATVVVLLLYALSVRRKPAAGGALLGLASAVKVFPLAAVPFDWKEKGWLHLLGVAAALGVALGVPWLCGWSFGGLEGLRGTVEETSINLSLWAQIGWGHYLLVAVLLIAALVLAPKGYPRVWLFPVLLFMLAPTLLRKAHFIAGMLTAEALFVPLSATRLARLVPALWAVGSLVTLLAPAAGAWFILVAYLVLLYDARAYRAVGRRRSRVRSLRCADEGFIRDQ